MKMVVPENTTISQQLDKALECERGLDSVDCSSLLVQEVQSEPGGLELEEVRKLQELVRQLEIQDQQLRNRSSCVVNKSLLGANTSSINVGFGNLKADKSKVLHNSINTKWEEQERQVMMDIQNKLGCIRSSEKENSVVITTEPEKRVLCSSIASGDMSRSSEPVNSTDTPSDGIISNYLCLDGIACTKSVEDALCSESDSVVRTRQSDVPSDSSVDSLMDKSALDEIELLDLDNCSEDEEDQWLYISPKKQPPAELREDNPLKWCRQILDHPSPETEATCRTFLTRLDQASSRWRSLYCSSVASPSVCGSNSDVSTCSNALNSPGYLKSTNKAVLTSGSTGYLSMHSALSSQSSIDSELSTSDDSISMGYKLQDLTDVQVMARLQEESLRQECASSASVSRRSSSASLSSLRRGTYSDQEFDTYSLEDEDDYDCAVSCRSAHRYSPSPLSSPRCPSPTTVGDNKGSASRIRPPRRSLQGPTPDLMSFSTEGEIRRSMPNLARTSLRSLELVKSSRSLESNLQVPNSRLSRIQQPSTGATSSKLRCSSSSGQSPLSVRQPIKAVGDTCSLATKQAVKAATQASPISGVRRLQSPGSSSGSSSSMSSGRVASAGSKAASVRSRTAQGGASGSKSKLMQPSKRSLPLSKTSSTTATDDSWKEGCY
ncbi:SLAIN motif-containing protein-like isoform X1 [Protopterus annectens]|uniref:SLAIN motif-containing protein-like isoform X1 n=1 Tax=Protopterus annectens TaxID=7888 RepID=UPI001CF952A1|nr:SLAIN motif-containing protein-like isoform X1 [Protopterus annectens]XP_043913693.1 SLAIN motif-containing protein-like isoform X1 [Protopterus annectens]XP_043913695.1 SLAIN motif-containing protein-like isoform X1 [Protopterus annectens]